MLCGSGGGGGHAHEMWMVWSSLISEKVYEVGILLVCSTPSIEIDSTQQAPYSLDPAATVKVELDPTLTVCGCIGAKAHFGP